MPLLGSCLLVVFALAASVRSLEKHWLGAVEWSDPRNWLEGRMPLQDSRLIFPPETGHAVAMPRHLSLRLTSIELPANGILALPETCNDSTRYDFSQVEGQCCYYCGGRIRLSKKTLMSTAQRIAASALQGYDSTIAWHSRLTWDGYTEILIKEKSTYESTDTFIAIAALERALKEDGVVVLFVETSGEPLHDHRLAMALGPILGSFLLLFFLALFLFPFFGYTFSQVWEASREVGSAICPGSSATGRMRHTVPFARFENVAEGNVQLAGGGSASPTASCSETFENPLYEEQPKAVKGRERDFQPNQAISLGALEKADELEQAKEIEMDIESL